MLLFAIIGCMEYGLIDKGMGENLAGDYETPSEPKTFGEVEEEETVIDEGDTGFEEPVTERSYRRGSRFGRSVCRCEHRWFG